MIGMKTCPTSAGQEIGQAAALGSGVNGKAVADGFRLGAGVALGDGSPLR
jgi:hypothetical protein